MVSQFTSRTFIALMAVMLWATLANAQDVVSLPSAIKAGRGAVVSVTVNGSLVANGHTRVVFEYPANVMRVRKVVGGNGFAFNCPTLFVGGDSLIGTTTGQLTVECWENVQASNTALFALEIEMLMGPGTEGVLKAVRFDRNKVPVTSAQLSQATITADGQAAVPDGVEGITGNYPNPFVDNSEFVFSLVEPGPVHLSIHTLSGRMVYDLGTIQATAGENHYHFSGAVWELASGPYIMVMETEIQSFMYQFMILK